MDVRIDIAKPMEKHVMVDLETLDIRPGAVIVSIGAVEFDIETGETGAKFYEKIDIRSCQKVGLNINADTLIWWMQQPDAARVEMCTGGKPLDIVLEMFNKFLNNVDRNKKNIRIWGNSSSFDCSILATAYNAVNMPCPWCFWLERDVRTIVALNPVIKTRIPFEGVQHHPLYDCSHQIKYLVATLKSLGLNSRL